MFEERGIARQGDEQRQRHAEPVRRPSLAACNFLATKALSGALILLMVRIVASRPTAGLPVSKRGAFRAIARQLRAGHAGADARKATCIGSGVRFLLGRKAAGRAPEKRVEAALQRICQEIREGRIDTPAAWCACFASSVVRQ